MTMIYRWHLFLSKNIVGSSLRHSIFDCRHSYRPVIHSLALSLKKRWLMNKQKDIIDIISTFFCTEHNF